MCGLPLRGMGVQTHFYSFSHLIANSVRWQKAIHILEAIEAYGGEAYIVGGALRDALWGEIGGDIDIATSLRPETIMRMFPKSYPTGAAFGTVTVIEDGVAFEITTFRKERYAPQDRHPSVAYADDLVSDLGRRDFTINALAWRSDGLLIDPFDGLRDLMRRRLKTVGRAEERFQEDPLRLLRALRFAWTYHLTIDAKTHAAIVACRETLKFVSWERIVQELEKMFMRVPPLTMARGLDRYGILLTMDKMEPFVALTTEDGAHFWWVALALGARAAVPFRSGSENGQEAWSWADLPLSRKTRRLIRRAESLRIESSNEKTRRLSLEALLQRMDMLRRLEMPAHEGDMQRAALLEGLYDVPPLADEDVVHDLWIWATQGARQVYEMMRLTHVARGYPRTVTKRLFSDLAKRYGSLVAPKPQDISISVKRLSDVLARPPGRWVGVIQKKLWEKVNFFGLPNEEEALLKAAQQMLSDKASLFKDQYD